MIKNVTIPARLCKCEALLDNGNPCLYEWVSISATVPTHCQNRQCRSREWNGKKIKRLPEQKPKVVLPRVVKVRGGEDDDF